MAQLVKPDAPVWAMYSDGVTLKVELALGWGTDPHFTLDDPVLGLLDQNILSGPDEPWVDVSCDVRSAEWQSGATNIDGLLTRWESGTATIVLSNEDDRYNTEDLSKRLLPMVKVRITAIENRVGGQSYPMWLGYADSFLMAWADSDSTVHLAASDGVKLLTAADFPELNNPVGDGETAAQRAQRILDAASWPDGTGFSPNDGGTLRMGTTMGADSWSQLLLNQDAELGATYLDRSGRFVFKPRDVWVAETIGDGTYQERWGPDDLRYENVTIKSTDTELRNIVSAARPGSTEQTVQDANSVAQFLPHSYKRDDLPFTNDPDSLTWANLVLQTSAWPQPRIDSVEVLPQIDPTNLWPVVLSEYASGFGVRWLVTVQTPGMSRAIQAPCQVMGAKHTVDRETWRVVYEVLEAPVITPFVLDGDPNQEQTLDSMRLTDSGITSVSPPSFSATATGTGVQINGKGFAGATAVTIGGVALRSGWVAIDTRINGYFDGGATPGLASVVVTTPTGVIQLYKGVTLT